MCSELKLLDITPLHNKSTTSFGISSSDDFQCCILVEDGIYILKLCGLMDNFLKTMSYMKWFIPTTDYALSSNLGIDLNSFISVLPKFDLYEAILRVDLSQELKEASPYQPQPVQAKWSGLGLVSNDNCALAVLTNTGALFVYVFTTNEAEIEDFVEICNVSEVCINYFADRFFLTIFRGDTPISMYEELKKRVEIVTPTAFTWSHVMSEDGKTFSFLIVGHFDGCLTVCRVSKIESNETYCDCKLVGYFSSNLRKPTFMHWQRANNNDGLLLIGDLEGRIKVILVNQMNYNEVQFENEFFLWEETDCIRIEHIKVIVHENNIYVLVVKGSILLITLIAESGTVLDVYPYYVGDLLITGVEHYEENTILVLTYTGVLQEVKLHNENNKIRIEWRHLFIDFQWWSHRTHGLILSHNKVFIGIVVSMSKLTKIKRRKDHVRLLTFMNVSKKPLEILLSNKSGKLSTYWDCFEVLRLNGLLNRKLSIEGLPLEADCDKLSLVQLKVRFSLAKLFEIVDRNATVLRSKSTLNCEDLKYILKIKLAMDHMYRLLEMFANGNSLSVFHMNSLDILNMFLKETISKRMIPKLGLGKVTIDGLYDVIAMANELKYPDPPSCVWCEEKIVGLSCVPAHPDSRCCISYMPITHLPYYRCQFCKCIVHSELRVIYNLLLCPYCDIPLNCVGTLINRDKESNNDVDSNSNSINVNCSSDCLQEFQDVNDVEHAFTYLNVNESVDLIEVSDDDSSN